MANPADVANAQTMYDAYVKAELSVLSGQAYSIGDRTLTRVDLRWIAQQRETWGNILERLQNGDKRGPQVQRVVPRDRL